MAMTMALASTAEQPSSRGALAGVILILSAVASFALLALHPMDNATDFAGMVKNEAAGRVIDAIVHGGFIAVLGVQFVCLAALAVKLGLRLPVLAGLVFTAAGMIALSGSLTIDGLVIPALATQLTTPEKIQAARNLFVLCSLLIRFLMPMGLLFQAAGAVGWGVALLHVRGVSRVVGVFGVLTGVVILAGIVATGMNPMALFGAIALLAVWNGVVAVPLLAKLA